MDTLKGYSDKCGEARTDVERAVQQAKVSEKDAGKKKRNLLSEIKKIRSDIDDVSKQQTEALERLRRAWNQI